MAEEDEIAQHFQALSLEDFEELGLEGEIADNGEFLLLFPNEPVNIVPWQWHHPEAVLTNNGTLEYPGECRNHHLAKNGYAKWRRNHIQRRRKTFTNRFVRRWGDHPIILRDPEGEASPAAFEVGSSYGLLREYIFPKFDDNETKKSATLVCKDWAREVRYITPYQNSEARLRRRVITYEGDFYKAKVTRGPDHNIHTISYQCACQRWDASIEEGGRVDWTLVEPNDDEFEDYLENPELKECIASLSSDEE